MTIAIAIFGFSLTGLVGVFGLKAWEVSRGRTVAPTFRGRLDAYALVLKRWGVQTGYLIEHLPFFAVWLMRKMVHLLATTTAVIARGAERRAHAIADLVSHKHSHERAQRQPHERSHFLTEVSNETNIEEASEREEEPKNDREDV